ncbi:MAG: class I SAM-dependent methyltransferase [Polyangiaceae bacterium]|nr:class I SAM-dependent methyltransferase [Polyangiaceae bacterium]
MQPLDAARARAAWGFLALGVRDFDRTASLVPSSRFLVDAMLRGLHLERARCVVELGTGTGTVTRELLARVPRGCVVVGVELDPSLAEATRTRCRDPRLRVVCACARRLPSMLEREHAGRVDAVVSSLGLSLMDAATRDEIVRAAGSVLGPGGVYRQYAYLHARWLAYSQARGAWFRWSARPFLERHYGSVSSELVAANLPPAVAYTCRAPRA